MDKLDSVCVSLVKFLSMASDWPVSQGTGALEPNLAP